MTIVTPRTVSPAVPLYFKALAVSVPLLIGVQLFFAGYAVFSGGMAWDLHREFGGVIGIVILILLGVTVAKRSLRSHRPAATMLFLLFCFQFVWLYLGQALGSGAVQALHPANATLLTAVSALLARRAALERTSVSS